MTILPLVGRELRVRARSPAGYWTRFAAALAGMLVCVPILTMSRGSMLNQAQLGRIAFDGLVVAAFVLCCFSGFLTVDGISRERREGTLGLLFLTRVKALDVLLGNFGAAGLAGLCALAAFVPVLIVPVLAGGVSGEEAARKVLALFDTMILSLATGLWASARGRTWWACARSAALVLISVIFFPLLLEQFVPLYLHSARRPVFWPGPLNALAAADEPNYKMFAGHYWGSIVAILAISWLLVIGAGIRLHRSLREEDEAPANSGRGPPGSEPVEDDGWIPDFVLANLPTILPKPPSKSEAPLEWLVRRQPGVRAVVWAGALLGMFNNSSFWVFLVFNRGALIGYSSWGMNLAFFAVERCLFAWAASRFFMEARRGGELELVMTTPEGARTIVASQWKWLKNVFRLPLVALIGSSVLVDLMMRSNYIRQYPSYYSFSQLLSVLNILAGVAALLWVGMWFGWSERSQGRAILRIVLLAQGVPYLIGMIVSRVASLFMSPSMMVNNPSHAWYVLVFSIPQMVNLLFYLWLIRWAKHRLAAEAGPVA
jgi:hypothetical protein